MPLIQINPDYFLQLGSLPFPQMLARIFIDGGWIPMLLVMMKGFWLLWVQSRQNKYAATLSFSLLAIDIPRTNEQTPKAVEQIFSHLSGAYSNLDRFEKYWLGKFQPTFSFELVSIGGYVQFLVRAPGKFRDLIEAAVYAQYPDAEIMEIADYADKIPATYPHPDWDLFGTEFILKKPSHYPIRTYIQFEHNLSEEYFKDPMSSVLESMGLLRPGEQMWLQFLVTPIDDAWRNAGEAAADKLVGRKKIPKKTILDQAVDIPLKILGGLHDAVMPPHEAPVKKPDDPLKMLQLTPGERGVLEAIQMKLSKIGFKVKIRLIYAGRRDVFMKGRVSSLKGAFGQFASLDMNGFKNYGPVTPKSDYFWQRWKMPNLQMKILRHYRNRSGKGATPFVLNIEELASVYHFPAMHVKAPSVKKTEAKRAEPPASLPVEGAVRLSPFERIVPKPPAAPPPEAVAGSDEAPADLPFA